MITLTLYSGPRIVLQRPLSASAIELVAEPLAAWARLESRPRAVLSQGNVSRIINLGGIQ